MKWKFHKVFTIIFVFFISIMSNKTTLAVKSTGLDEVIGHVVVEMSTDASENTNEKIETDILKKLQEWGYTGNEVTKEMKIKTTLHINGKTGNDFNIRIGNDTNSELLGENTISVSEKVLKEIYGYPADKTVSDNDSWEAFLVIESYVDNPNQATTCIWQAILQEVYTGDDIKEVEEKEVDDERIDVPDVDRDYENIFEEIWDATAGVVGNTIDFALDVKDFFTKLKDNVLRDAIGTVIYYILEIARFIFADIEQTLINLFQTSTDHSIDCVYTYSKDRLMKEGTDGKRNKYTQVSDYAQGQGKSWQKIVDIAKEDDDLRFDETSKIPVMTGDWYNAAVGHIDIFDVNFLTGNKDHDEGSIWMIIRNFAAACIHVTIYAASAIILITLFIYGIQILTRTFKSPGEEADFKSRLNKFVTSVATLIGCVLIMAICIFGSNALFNSFESRETSEQPIRVNVEGAGYSFSTTPIGYIGYMAKSNDVKRCGEKFAYTVVYILLVWCNVLVIFIMFIRTIAMWILAIVGPVTAVLQIFDIETSFNFRMWIRYYVILSLTQIFISFVNMLVLENSF